MMAAERTTKILEIINATGAVKVEQLAKELGVSEMTIRRDLEKCDKNGSLQRCHGGAILKSNIQREMDYDEKRQTHQGAKRHIAAACAQMVEEGSTVYLDAGTTTFEIAQLIQSISNLTILTNDLLIAASLLKSDVELIVLGGEVQKSTGSMIGNIAQQIMENMRVDISFMGTMSIDDSFNSLSPTIEKAFLKRMITQNSNKSYLVADASKFSQQALIKINSLSDYTGVVTNKEFTSAELRLIREKNINIISVSD